MDIQAQKLELIQWLAEINDSSLISQFVRLKQASISEEDNSISNSIEKGLADIKNEKVKSHSEVNKKYGKWL